MKFLNEAKIIQQEQIINRSNSKEETIKANEIKLENIRQIHEENINVLQREIEERDNIISQLKTKISLQEDELKNKDENWQAKIEEQRSGYNKKIVSLKDEIKRKDLIRKIPVSEIDMELLCDSIEFLAYEHRDQILGIKNKEEINNICSKKYNRPFDVGSSGDLSVCKYPKEYKIKYGKGFTGKPVEVPLNMHLKVGNDNENLLRIYFLFDKVKKLIVVGSLPKHLPTILYK